MCVGLLTLKDCGSFALLLLQWERNIVYVCIVELYAIANNKKYWYRGIQYSTTIGI
jgi:hypothetical protein